MKRSAYKYFGVLLSMSIIAVAGIVIFSCYLREEAIRLTKEEFNDQQVLLARQTAIGIKKNLKSLFRELELLSRIPAIMEMDFHKAREHMEQTFDYERSYYVNDIALLDSEGINRVSLKAPHLTNKDFSYRKYFKEARSLKTSSPVYEFIEFKGVDIGEKGIVIAVPVFSHEEKFNGVIIFTLMLNELIKEFVPLETEGSATWVMDSEGTVLYHPRYAPGTILDALPRIDSSFKMFVETIKKGKLHKAEYISQEGARMLAASYPFNIAGEDWFIVKTARIDSVGMLLLDYNSKYGRGTLIALLTVIINSIIVLFLVNRWNVRLQDEVAERKNAEDELQKIKDGLELRVEERTEELKSAIELLRDEIGDRKEIQQDLWESEEQFRTLVEQSTLSIQILDPEGLTIRVNRAWEEMWGLTLENLEGYNVLHDKQLEKLGILSYLHKAYSGEAAFVPANEYDANASLGKGRSRWVEARIYPVKDERGAIRFVVIMHEDITEQKKADEALKSAKKEIEEWNRELERKVREKTDELLKSQEQLIQSEKLSAMGQMAGGLAHELNSPLGGLLPMIENYKEETPEDSEKYRELSLMLKACEHMSRIVKDFGTFSRESKGELYELNLNDVIEDTLSFSAGRFKQKTIRIIKEYNDTLPNIKGEKTELQQVILNIVMNAYDAMSEGGTFQIKTGISKDSDHMFMDFIDNGTGIEKEKIDKIFDPFFTTKRPGKGTGLGLSLSYKIIEKHSGRITVESEPGKGACFRILLPKI